MSGCVLDASVIVAALVDRGAEGRWAEERIAAGDLVAPHLAPIEAMNLLRRLELAGTLEADDARASVDDLGRLPLVLFPLEPFADRVWELRRNLTAYDAWYVALAESLELPLVTLDRRLTRADGPTCRFATPP